MYVQYGCGSSTAEGWRNFDSSPTLRLERLGLKRRRVFPPNAEYGDIIKGLPVPASSCDGVYCAHVLEHLALDDFRRAVRNSLVVLKPGGIFRLVVPDLEVAVRRYVEDPSDDACRHFMEDAHLGLKRREKGLRALLAAAFGAQSHLWMWDYKMLRSELQDAGFERVRRAAFEDALDPAFRSVEVEERWFESLGVECFRPRLAASSKHISSHSR